MKRVRVAGHVRATRWAGAIRRASVLGSAVVCVVLGMGPLGARVAMGQQESRRGFAAARSGEQDRFEQALQRTVSADSIARWARGLAGRPHVAGTPAQAATRDSVLDWLRAAGLDVSADSELAYLPQTLRAQVERLAPDPLRLPMLEDPLPGDPATLEPMVPAFNAYSGQGRVTGEVVYANYGLPDDYRVLDSLGVSVAGKIVVVRYGRSFRGIKSREAEARGAAGLVLYTDPVGDGYRAGDVYPRGPMRPASGVQRGSLLNSAGDPSTPDGPSVAGVRRVPEAEMRGIAHIPVAPLGYGAAAELLRGLEGPGVPRAWQGALPFHYHAGPGPVIALIDVRRESGEQAYHPIYNTVATVRGSRWPDEWVVVGGHRDAWGPGASDNVSGAAAVVESARAFAALAAAGMPPARSVLFATWDAEEWGLIGSTEWVERNAERLARSAVAYVNVDGAAGGPNFGGAASPELKRLVRAVTQVVRYPEAAVVGPGAPDSASGSGSGSGSADSGAADSGAASPGSVYERWVAHTWAADGVGKGGTGAAAAGAPTPILGNLGGGSDHEAFYQHLAIPSAGFGFSGPNGVYHSAYDTPTWMEHFGDPGYRFHVTTARILSVMAARLANADLLPYDFGGMATEVSDQLKKARAEAGVQEEEEDALSDAEEALESFRDAAIRWKAARDSFLARKRPAPDVAREVNRHVRAVSLAFASERGLPDDPWSRQLLFASDPANGYATLPLPALRLALRAGDSEAARLRARELAQRLRLAGDELRRARTALNR